MITAIIIVGVLNLAVSAGLFVFLLCLMKRVVNRIYSNLDNAALLVGKLYDIIEGKSPQNSNRNK